MLLLATDGLFDNMSEDIVLDELAACADAPVERIAHQLAHRAHSLGWQASGPPAPPDTSGAGALRGRSGAFGACGSQ